MVVTRQPRPALRPFVALLWSVEERSDNVTRRREHVLPTGQMHLAVRLAGGPLRIVDDDHEPSGRVLGEAVFGGARTSFYVKEVAFPGCSVGAQLRPGAAQALAGFDADELSGGHTPLADLWGHAEAQLRERLIEAASPAERLDIFEAVLAERLPRARGLDPAVAEALARLRAAPDVREAVRRSGYSHRTLVARFRRSVGVTPKLYCRLLRFQRALGTASTDASWTHVALAAGYSDQAHFTREFREFAGVTPSAYRLAAPTSPHHVPVAAGPR